MRSIALLVLVGCGRVEAPLPDAPLPDAPLPDAPAPQMISGLIAWYTMDVETNGIAVDASGDPHNATCIAGTSSHCPKFNPSGRVGGSYSFEGDQFLRVAAAPYLKLTSGFTISLWIMRKAEADGDKDGCIINQLLDQGNNAWQACTGNDGMSFRTTTNQGMTDAGQAMVSLPFGAWNHIALWWDSQRQIKRIYVNGLAKAEVQPIDIGFENIRDLAIGSDIDPDGLFAPFGGEIDDVRIYDRALLDIEIGALQSPD